MNIVPESAQLLHSVDEFNDVTQWRTRAHARFTYGRSWIFRVL